jgi:hypothetical protein
MHIRYLYFMPIPEYEYATLSSDATFCRYGIRKCLALDEFAIKLCTIVTSANSVMVHLVKAVEHVLVIHDL